MNTLEGGEFGVAIRLLAAKLYGGLLIKIAGGEEVLEHKLLAATRDYDVVWLHVTDANIHILELLKPREKVVYDLLAVALH